MQNNIKEILKDLNRSKHRWEWLKINYYKLALEF